MGSCNLALVGIRSVDRLLRAGSLHASGKVQWGSWTTAGEGTGKSARALCRFRVRPASQFLRARGAPWGLSVGLQSATPSKRSMCSTANAVRGKCGDKFKVVVSTAPNLRHLPIVEVQRRDAA
jgi:hypothetical protein